MIELCGLWLNKKNDGEEYFSGKLGNVKLLVFKNKYKTADNQPDYKICIAPVEKKQEKPTDQVSVPDEPEEFEAIPF